MQSRFAAWDILLAVGSGAYCEVAIERVFQKYNLSAIDKALATELAYGAIRQRKFLDCWIDYLAKISALKQPPLLRWLFHIGLYQIFFMDRIPVSAAVNTSVELAKKKKLERLAPVINAVLRKAIRAHNAEEKFFYPKNNADSLACHYSLPNWLAKELILWRGEEKVEQLAKAFNCVPSIDLRVNRKRTNVINVQERLLQFGIESSVIDSCPFGLNIVSGSGDLRQWPGYKEGDWSVQDRSAQWVAPLMKANPGELILDACAAPGGKTTHLAEIMSDRGEIWAVDYSSKRLQRTKKNASRLGLESIKFLHADSTALLKKMPHWKGYFDRILLDAPCSGLGTLARNPDLRWRVSPTKINELVKLQVQLLEGILPALKTGGRIVYSTCTINPEENCRQIKRFISCHDEFRLKDQTQIWPSIEKGGDGFYAAIMELVG